MNTNLHTADILGQTLAQIADLTKIADQLKAELRAQGDGDYEGALFRATVSTYDRTATDWKAIKKKISHQLFNAHTTVETSTRVVVKSKTGVEL